jgi:hypothetical protein
MPSGIKRIFASVLSSVTAVPKEEVGTIRFEGKNIYKYVKIQNVTATVAGAAGDPVPYRADKYDEDWVVVDNTDADAVGTPAGVLMGTVAGVAGTAYYGWIQIRGFATLLTALVGPPTVGSELTILAASADKTVIVRTYAGGGAANGGLFGRVMHVANKEVILDCVF